MSDSQSAIDIMQQMQDLLSVNGVFKTSAKDGKKIKIAIACLVREILKEESFLNRIEDNTQHLATGGAHGGKNSGFQPHEGAADSTELQVPEIQVAGRRRESI